MKQLWILTISGLVSLSILSGCNKPPVFDSAAGGFPKFLAGTWKADKGLWEFTFEPNGTISSFHNNLDVQIVVEEGGGYTEVAGGIKIEYIIGPCEAKYTPGTGNLAVTIVTEQFLLAFPKGALQGSSTDKFSGKVSRQDKTWNAKWTSFDKLSGIDPGSSEDAVSQELIFKKLPRRKTPKENLK